MRGKKTMTRRLRQPLGRWLTALLLVMVLVGHPVHAEGALSGVDLTRIKISSSKEPVVLEMGELQFRGFLSQAVPFNQAEINKLVKQCLEQNEMTQLQLIEAQRLVEKARIASTYVKAEAEERVRQNLLKSIAVVPEMDKITSILKVVDTYTKTKSWDDVGAASATLLEQSSSDWVKDTAFGMVNGAGELGENINAVNQWMGALGNITDFCSMMLDEYDRNYLKWQDIANGANAKRDLNKFYWELMERIDGYKKTSIEGGWILDFKAVSDGRNFRFFGSAANQQTWDLDMELKQETKNKEGSAAGEYSGNYFLNAEHDISGFTGFSEPEAIIKQLPTLAKAYEGLKSTGMKVKLSGSHSGQRYVSRAISGNARATIHPDGTMEIQLSPASDETQVNITGMKIVLRVDAYAAIVKSGGLFEFELGAEKEDLGIVSGMANLSVIAPDFAQNTKHQGKGFTSQGWDTTLWKPLETPPVLRHE